uniref:Uncharacterized protein n=1 Tax=Arundo donax TaxID=35708 RepID=A0A0A9EJM1_ARUDO
MKLVLPIWQSPSRLTLRLTTSSTSAAS